MLKKLIFALIIFIHSNLMAQTIAHWKFDEGTGNSTITDYTLNKQNGRFINPINCEWSKEDDRGYFLTLSTGGSVQVPHNDKLSFNKSFVAEFVFSCNLEKINNDVAFASLLTKGSASDYEYSVLINKDGNILLKFKGVTPAKQLIKTNLKSNVDYYLKIEVKNNEVKVHLNNKIIKKYATRGKLNSNKHPLSIGAVNGKDYPFCGNIYEIKLSDESVNKIVKKENKVLNFTPYPIHDPSGTIIFNDLTKLKSTNKRIANIPTWAVRTSVAFMGKQTKMVLNAPEGYIPAKLAYNPKLTGTYDIYAGVRAIDRPTSVQIKLSSQKEYYTIKTASVGKKHRNMELLLGRNIRLDRNNLEVAGTGKRCFLGYIKFIPSNNRRAKENPQDPAGKVTIRPKYSYEEITIENNKLIADKIKKGYFVERTYVETNKPPKYNKQSIKRGYAIYNCNYLKLIFPTSVPEEDTGKIKLKVSATPGEYEPSSFAVKAIRNIDKFSVKQIKEFRNKSGSIAKINCVTSIVKPATKRTSSYHGRSEFMVGPQYLEAINEESSLNFEKGEAKQIWLTFHVADNSKSGTYYSELEIVSNNTKQTMPIEFKIYPFKLTPIENIDIGFWTNANSYSNPDGISFLEKDIKNMVDYGKNSVVFSTSLTVKGRTLNDINIDFGNSLLVHVARLFKKYNMSGTLHLLAPNIWSYTSSVPQPQRIQAYKKLLTQLENYAKSNNWPKRAYHCFDECLSHPENLPGYIRNIKVQKELGLTTANDHIWYKTSRPLQDQVDKASPYIDIFINRFNTRNLWYVDSWEKMLDTAKHRNKKLYTYNSTSCITAAQPAAMRCLGGWFFRTIGKGCSGQLFWTYRSIQGDPYNDLDGTGADVVCTYPPYGKHKGGPAIDWEAHREGIDDLRYILTLENLIDKAKKENLIKEAVAAQKVIDSIADSFDWERFRQKAIFWDSKWTKTWSENGKRFAAGDYNLPNGWEIKDYDVARQRIVNEILKLQSKVKDN